MQNQESIIKIIAIMGLQPIVNDVMPQTPLLEHCH